MNPHKLHRGTYAPGNPFLSSNLSFAYNLKTAIKFCHQKIRVFDVLIRSYLL